MPVPRLDLLVVADSFGGGLGVAAQAHARWFADQGWSVVLAAPNALEDPVAPAQAVDLPVPAGAFDTIAMARAARVLRSVLRQRRPRVVHAHGTRSQTLTLLAGRVPMVTMHGAGRIEGQGMAGTLVRRSGRWLAPCLSTRAYSAWPVGGRWRTLLHASPRLAQLTREPPELLADTPTFVWIGRLDPPKKPELFVRACALAARERSLRGLVVGDGTLRQEVQELVDREQAPVQLLGEVEDIGGLLTQAWAVCLFSSFEAASFSLQEGMWVGRAVVASPLPSLKWLAGSAAIFASDVDTVAAALVRLCDRSEATRFGALAADRAREVLEPDAHFRQLMADYRRGVKD